MTSPDPAAWTVPGAQSVTVAQYLATRLHQAGVRHLFGVPGDFSLGLLDAVEATGLLEWVGTANELDAGYAADGYARRRGLAAVVTTYGVGELSCLNAIAGSYAEQVPVLQITGSPATRSAAAGAFLHHTLCDGDFGHFARAYREVTAAAEVLTVDAAASQIDRVLRVALTHSRPVYLSVPMDLVQAPVDAAALARPIAAESADPAALAGFTAAARRLLVRQPGPTGQTTAAGVGRPVLVAGHLVQRLRAEPALRALVEAGSLPTVSLLSSKGVLDENHPCYAGVYAGELGDRSASAVVRAAPVQITVGTLMSDVVAGFFTQRHDVEHTITVQARQAVVGGDVFDGVPLALALEALTTLVAALAPGWVVGTTAPTSPVTGSVTSPVTGSVTGSDGNLDALLTQAQLWAAVERWLPAGCALVADIGTAFWGAAGITFPPDTVFIAQPVWSSIGYALPATLGCALADPRRRPVLVIGDGAAQMTAQELGTIATRVPGAILIVVDNRGYTIERALQSPRAGYNDVVRWDWGALVRAMAPDAEPLTLHAGTEPDLVEALRRAEKETGRVTLIQVDADRLDAPVLLQALATAVQQRR